MHCVNINHIDVQNLAKELGINPVIAAAKIALWQENNGLDKFPTVDDILQNNEVKSTEENKKELLKDENFDNEIKSILSEVGINIEIIEKLLTDNGQDAVAVADLMNKVIKLVKDKVDSKTLSEEVAHFIIDHLESIGNKEVLNLLTSTALKKTKIYQEVLEEYKDVYTKEEDFVREALGKMLRDSLYNNFKISNDNKSFIGKLKRIWKAIVNTFTNTAFENKLNNFLNKTSKNFLTKKYNFDTQSTGKLYQLTKKEDTIINDSLKALKTRLGYLRRNNLTSDAITVLLPDYIDAIEKYKTKEEMDKIFLKFFAIVERDLKKEYNSGEGIKGFLNKFNEGLIKPEDVQPEQVNKLRSFLHNYKKVVDSFTGYIFDSKDEKIKNLQQSFSTLQSILNRVEDIVSELEITTIDNFIGNIDLSIDENKNISFETLKTAQKDVSLARVWFLSPLNTSSKLIKAFTYRVVQAKQKVSDHVNDVKKRLLKLDEKLREKNFDFNTLFETKDGKLTNYYISEYNRTDYMIEVEKLNKQVEEINSFEGDAGEFYDKFYNLIEKFNSEFKKYPIKTRNSFINTIKDENPKKKLIGIAYRLFYKENTIEEEDEYGEKTRIPHSKFKNKNYKNIISDPDVKLYLETVLAIRKEDLSKMPKSVREAIKVPGWTYDEMLTYKIPQVKKNLIQVISTGKGLKNLWRETIGVEDIQEAYNTEANENSKGIRHKVVPIYYIQDVEEESLSRDITVNSIIFTHMSENFKQMSKIASYYEIFKDLSKKLNIQKGKEIISFNESNTAEVLDNLIGINVFNEKVDPSYVEILGKTVNVTQLMDNVNSWMRNNNLIMKHATALSGHIKGFLDNKIENLVGEITTTKSSVYAEKEWLSNIGQVIAQTYSNKQTNKMQLYFEELELFKAHKEQYKNLAKNKGLRLMASSDFWYGFYIGPSYRLIGKLAIAIGDNYRFIGNKFYNKLEFMSVEGNTEEKWNKLKDEGMTFYQLMQDNSKIGKEAFNNAKLRVIHTIRKKAEDIEGRMTDIDRAKASKTALIRLALTHKSWLFKGIDLRFKKYHYDNIAELETEGYYRTVANYLKDIFIKENDKYKLQLSKFNIMTPLQKRAFVRTGLDLAFLGMLLTIHHLLAAMADDEDDWYIDYIAYVSARVYMEQISLISPSELYQTFKNPLPTIDRVGYIGDVVTNLLSSEEIERGPYKGLNKGQKGLIQLTPGLSVFWDYNDPDSKRHRLEQSFIIGF